MHFLSWWSLKDASTSFCGDSPSSLSNKFEVLLPPLNIMETPVRLFSYHRFGQCLQEFNCGIKDQHK